MRDNETEQMDEMDIDYRSCLLSGWSWSHDLWCDDGWSQQYERCDPPNVVRKTERNGDEFMNRKLYRSSTNRMICGLCGGIGEYLGVDATLVRLIWAIVACSGTGLLAYILAAVIIPENPGSGY